MNRLKSRYLTIAAGILVSAGCVAYATAHQDHRHTRMERFSVSRFEPLRTMADDTSGIRALPLVPATGTVCTPRASARQAADVPTIYGSIIASREGADGSAANGAGMWTFNADGPIKRLNTNGKAQHGGAQMANGNYYAIMRSGASTYIDRFPVSTWKRAAHTRLSSNALMASDVAYDPTSDMVYGCFYNDAGDGYVFGRADYATRKREAIKPLSIGYNAVMVDVAGQVYAIDMTGTLLKLDKATGEARTIGHTSVTPQYVSSATIDPNTGRCYWTVNPASGLGYLYEVDLTTGQATMLHQFAHADEITGIFVPEQAPVAGAPGKPVELKADFGGGALTGMVSFILPDTDAGGSPLEGNVEYTLWVDGLVYAGATGQPGARIELPVTMGAAGQHALVVRCSNSTGAGARVSLKMFAGNDTPKAPAPVLKRQGDTFTVSWAKVTAAVNNGFIDPQRVTYKVTRLPDNVVVAQSTADTVVTDVVVPTPGRVIAYKYSVSAIFEGNEGAAGTTAPYPVGEIEAPWNEGFDNADALNNFLIVDGNNDGVTWKYSASMSSAYITNSSKKHDDWLISAGIRMRKGVNYKLIFEVMASFNPERIEVRMGRAAEPEAMTTVLVPPTDLTADCTLKPALPEFTVPEDGLYYIGWHAISDADAFYMYLDNITLTDDANHEVEPITPPYEESFSESAALRDYTIIDGNNDGYIWNIDNGAARVMAGNGLNDWLITPPVTMQAGRHYEISALAHGYIAGSEDRLEIRIGKSPSADAMTTVVVPGALLGSASAPSRLADFFVAPADGNYYVALHAVGNGSGVYVDYLRIAAPVVSDAPAAPTQCRVVAAPYGELKATVSCKAPAQTAGGAQLTSMQKVEVMLADSVAHTFTNPQPGAELQCEVKVDKSGTHDFRIVAVNEAGTGIPAELSAYVGVNVPSHPTGVELVEEGNTGKVNLYWHAPLTDVEGNLIRPTGLSYTVSEVVNGQSVLLARDITDTTFSIQAVAPGAQQQFKTYAVYASNAAGMGKGAVSNSIPVGKPDATPYLESFANGQPSHCMVTSVLQPQGQWNTYRDNIIDVSAQDNDNGFVGFTGANAGSAGVLYTGKIDLGTLDKPDMMFYAYNPYADNTNELVVQLMDKDGNVHPLMHKTLAQIGTDGWNKVYLSLRPYKGQIVRLAFATYMRYYTMSLLDHIYIDTTLGAASIDGGNVKVSGRAGYIDIFGAEGKMLTVCDVQGRIICSQRGEDVVSVSVVPGIYLVRVAGRTFKVIVK